MILPSRRSCYYDRSSIQECEYFWDLIVWCMPIFFEIISPPRLHSFATKTQVWSPVHNEASALYSLGATWPHEQLPGFSSLCIFFSILSLAGQGFMEESIKRFLHSFVSIFQSAWRLDHMVPWRVAYWVSTLTSGQKDHPDRPRESVCIKDESKSLVSHGSLLWRATQTTQKEGRPSRRIWKLKRQHRTPT
jgi:hypothetical protein